VLMKEAGGEKAEKRFQRWRRRARFPYATSK
jgi:hypothetical protein